MASRLAHHLSSSWLARSCSLGRVFFRPGVGTSTRSHHFPFCFARAHCYSRTCLPAGYHPQAVFSCEVYENCPIQAGHASLRSLRLQSATCPTRAPSCAVFPDLTGVGRQDRLTVAEPSFSASVHSKRHYQPQRNGLWQSTPHPSITTTRPLTTRLRSITIIARPMSTNRDAMRRLADIHKRRTSIANRLTGTRPKLTNTPAKGELTARFGASGAGLSGNRVVAERAGSNLGVHAHGKHLTLPYLRP